MEAAMTLIVVSSPTTIKTIMLVSSLLQGTDGMIGFARF